MVAHDITLELSQESELVRAQKVEGMAVLAGGVAHDFNNVLQTILGWSEILLITAPLSEEHSGQLGSVAQAARQGAALTRQLLALSREQPAAHAPLNVGCVVAEMEKMLLRVLGHHHGFERRQMTSEAWILGDPLQMEQLILNLVVNARDAMSEGAGTCIIEVSRFTSTDGDSDPGEFVRVTVRDTGAGMDAQTRERVFEPFFTTKSAGHGTGLGLAVVSRIVQQHAGNVSVESAPGAGTSFHVDFPAVAQPATTDPVQEADAELICSSGWVLVVEDIEDVRRLLVASLTSFGFDVMTAASGTEACELITRADMEIAFLVTDLLLPGRNGTEVADEYRRCFPNGKVLFISGFADSLLVHQAINSPGAAFLRKPFGPRQLSNALRQLTA